MELKLSKTQLVKLIKEAKKLSVKSLIKENILTPQEEDIVRRATKHGYKSRTEDYSDDSEAYQVLRDLHTEYNRVGFRGLSDLHKAIIDAQEDNKEQYRAGLTYDYDLSDSFAAQAEEDEFEKIDVVQKKLEQDEQDENDKIDTLYKKQDELSGIRIREGHPDIDIKMAEIEKDPAFEEFQDSMEKKNKEEQIDFDDEDTWLEDILDGEMEREGSKREY